MNLTQLREVTEQGFEAASLTHQDRNTGDVYVLIDVYKDFGYSSSIGDFPENVIRNPYGIFDIDLLDNSKETATLTLPE